VNGEPRVLQKIICIKNVSRFKSCAAAGDVTFQRVTLIFGENGRGKTTLCAILRSLLTNTPALILGRSTLGSMEQPEVELLTSNGAIEFRNGAWSAAFPNMAIFDGAYVSENVFAGDVVDTEHRRNLYRVIIGAQGVALVSRLNDLDNQIRSKNNDLRVSRARLERYVPSGMTVEAFLELQDDAEIDARITAKEQDLQSLQRAAQLQRREVLTALVVPVFPAAFAELLARTFANVEADAAHRVAEHVASHHMEARGETWLSEGLRYVADDSCPFCGQRLTGVDLIQAYRSFFGREYHELRETVTRLRGQVDTVLGDRVAATIEQTLLQNNNSVEFWQQYCEIVPPVLPEAQRITEVVVALRQAAQSLLQIKAGTPLEAVPPDDVFTQALASFEELRTSFGAYNAAVATANAVIAARKRQTRAENVADAERALALLRAQKARHLDDVRAICAADTTLRHEKDVLEAEKSAMLPQGSATQDENSRNGGSNEVRRGKRGRIFFGAESP
jgi:wobble nucleotide-excising tRNase